MKAVCSKCGAEDSIYREVQIYERGIRSVEAEYVDGKLKVTEGDTVPDDTALRDVDPEGYACSECEASAAKVEDLVTPENTLAAGQDCACGHDFAQHTANRQWDKKLHTRPLRPCSHCHCRDYETDPVLASVAA